ncbi:MAG TPA: YhdH/YhfP family quinone oxidoreductase [Clostridia bacterium]|nr:YhdH/YhfP family quinone oxidoreductase [Clostridia bacterium]
MDTFKAFRVFIDEKDKAYTKIIERSIDDLPEGEILIKVKYSSLNYKDALSSIGNRGITKEYPHTPGIDAAGIVVKSESSKFKEGDSVIVTGYDLGMNTDGGFSEYIRVPSEWPVPLPEGLTLKDAMVYGTAGFTAALSVKKVTSNGVEKGKVLVTGATGGVGSTAIAILNKIGYEVIAATGKLEKEAMLEKIGASQVIHREKIDSSKDQLLLSGEFSAAIDTIGGNTLATAIKMVNYDGVVTTCGNVRGDTFESSIYPFILRGVHLIGIYSAKCPRKLRLQIWKHLSSDWNIGILNQKVKEISLEDLPIAIEKMLSGKLSNRMIIKL